MKRCIKCKKEKELGEFYFRSDTQKYRGQCRECESEIAKEYHELNREKRILDAKKWYNKNKQRVSKRDKEYNKSKKRKEYIKEYQLKNKERLKLYRKNWGIKVGRITGRGQSKEEQIIEQFLKKKGFRLEKEKTFETCINKDGNLLYFDFFIPYKNTIIEYDGIYHFEPIFGKRELKKRQEFDKIKNEFCKSEEINLIRINYQQDLQQELINLKF